MVLIFEELEDLDSEEKKEKRDLKKKKMKIQDWLGDAHDEFFP
jgi:hypothetical protein